MFYVIDGQVASDINDLLKAIKTMQENAYIYHANKQKNDFSNWLRDVLNEKEIAEKIRNSSRDEAVKLLEEHLRPKTMIQHVIHNTKKLRNHIKNTLTPEKKTTEGTNAVKEAVQETKSLDSIINPSVKSKGSKLRSNLNNNSSLPSKKSGKTKKVKLSEVRKLNSKDLHLYDHMMPRALTTKEKDDHFSKALNEIIAREKRIEMLESQIEDQINHSKTMKSEDFIYGIIVGIVLAFSIYLIYGAIV